jgi:hypothetical protein
MTRTRFQHHAGDIDDAQREAQQRMEETCEAIQEAGIEAGGFVGDADPALAIADALATFNADRVIISTHPEGKSLWLEDGVVDRAREEHELPVDHVVVDLDAETESEGQISEVDRDERSPEEIATEEGAGETDIDSTEFMSRATTLETAGIATGIISTVVLAVLAIGCSSGSQSIDVVCGLRYLLGIGVALITFWHAIALMMMRSVKYVGFWEGALAKGLLFGGPLAVGLSLLVGLFK